jgi:hypothetical protein
LRGRAFSPYAEDEVLLGKIAANTLGIKLGDVVEIDLRRFRVVGIYETGNLLEDGGALIPLRMLQKLKNRPAELTVILVRVHEGVSVEDVMARVEREYGGSLITLRSAEEFNRNYQSLSLVRAGSWLISLLALVIGGIGVMNTMIMSVFERTREIGILRAVGWRRRRVLQLILGESLMLGAIAAIVGTLLGWGAARAVTLLPQVRGLIGPLYTPELFTKALVIALLVGWWAGSIRPTARRKSPPTRRYAMNEQIVIARDLVKTYDNGAHPRPRWRELRDLRRGICGDLRAIGLRQEHSSQSHWRPRSARFRGAVGRWRGFDAQPRGFSGGFRARKVGFIFQLHNLIRR